MAKKKEVLAVDGDIIAYRTAAVCEDHFEGACEDIIRTTLTEIATDTGISDMRIYISGEGNFRYDVAKTKPYKGNRATMVRPRFLHHCKEFLISEFKALKVHGFEADDGIASDMVQNGAYHCGIDKDILQIAGRHYNYVNKEWQEIDEDDAILILYRQVLCGDSSDNIPGLPRVGPKTAENVIFSAKSARQDALSYYREICEEKLPDVDYKEYFAEQEALISMVTDLDLFKLFTCHIEPNTDGFEQQDGEDLGFEPATPKPRTPPKL